MIDTQGDVKTGDGYLLRLFCVGFTEKRYYQIRKTSRAQIQKMMKIIIWEVQTNDLKEVASTLILDSMGKDIEKPCQSIYSLHVVFVRNVKMPKKLKLELGNLLELPGGGGSSGKTISDETSAEVLSSRQDG